MRVKLMGVQHIDFINEETGERIMGEKLHVVSFYPEDDARMTGFRCATIFTRLPVPDFKPGDSFELDYEQVLGSNKSRLVAINHSQ